MNAYSLNLAAKTLTITKAFEDAVATGEGPEFERYMKLMSDIPGLTVIRRTHKTPSKYQTKSGETYKCNQFKNLTYKNMEGFIKILPEHDEFLTTFNFLRNYAALVQTARYTAVRRWFVAQFPEFRKNPLFYFYNPVKAIDTTPIIQQAQEEANELAEKKAQAAAQKEAEKKTA